MLTIAQLQLLVFLAEYRWCLYIDGIYINSRQVDKYLNTQYLNKLLRREGSEGQAIIFIQLLLVTLVASSRLSWPG